MNPIATAENAVKELEAALWALGWELDGPKQTPRGWKATIRHGTVSVLASASKIEEVLGDLLRTAEEHAKKPPEQP